MGLNEEQCRNGLGPLDYDRSTTARSQMPSWQTQNLDLTKRPSRVSAAIFRGYDSPLARVLRPYAQWHLHYPMQPLLTPELKVLALAVHLPQLRALALFGRMFAERAECLVIAGVQKPTQQRS